MKLLSFKDRAERDRVGAIEDEVIRDLTDFLPPDDGVSPMRRLLAGGYDLHALLRDAPRVARGETTIQPPVPDPTKIVAAPVNYRAHQAEMNESTHIAALGVFLKAPSSVLADGGEVRLPYHDRRFDQEGELAVVIGKPTAHVSEDDALEHIFGYTCLLDMTMRGGEDRSVRKSFDTFTPMGPYLVTADEVGDMELWCRVNGALRQHAQLADLIWPVPRLVSYVSSVMRLHPGDVIATGTPAGVGPVFDGDIVQVEISGVGLLSVRVSARDAVRCPTLGRDRGPTPPPHPSLQTIILDSRE